MALLDLFMESPAGNTAVLLATAASCVLCYRPHVRWSSHTIPLPALTGLLSTFIMFQIMMAETAKPGVWHDDLRLYLRPHLVPGYLGLAGSVIVFAVWVVRRKTTI